MNINEFNSKINLPYLFEAAGKRDYSFVKLPTFGWFAYNKDFSDIRNLFDNMIENTDSDSEIFSFCSDLVKEKKQYFDFHINYSELGFKKLANHFKLIYKMKEFMAACRTELIEGQAFVDGKYTNLSKQYIANGMEAILDTGIGLCTERVLNAYSKFVKLPYALKNKIIIPSFATPKHICSYEYCAIKNIVTRKNDLFTNVEKGFYGNVNNPKIYGSFSKLTTNRGFTWDKKANPWINKPIAIATDLTIHDYLKIWIEGKDKTFVNSPLDIIEATNNTHLIKFNLKDLNLAQVDTLQQRFSLNLVEHWQQQTIETINLGCLKFVKRDGCYWIEYANGKIDEYTNFTIDLTRIVKKGEEIYREGFVNFGNTQLAIRWEDAIFQSPKKLVKKIHELFMSSGLGLPLVMSNYVNFIPDIVNRFNRNVKIEKE